MKLYALILIPSDKIIVVVYTLLSWCQRWSASLGNLSVLPHLAKNLLSAIKSFSIVYRKRKPFITRHVRVPRQKGNLKSNYFPPPENKLLNLSIYTFAARVHASTNNKEAQMSDPNCRLNIRSLGGPLCLCSRYKLLIIQESIKDRLCKHINNGLWHTAYLFLSFLLIFTTPAGSSAKGDKQGVLIRDDFLLELL